MVVIYLWLYWISGLSDIRPFLVYGRVSGIRMDIRFNLPDIWLDGYRISGSSIHKIVDNVNNDNYFFLKGENCFFHIYNFFFRRISGLIFGICQIYWADIWPNQYPVQPLLYQIRKYYLQHYLLYILYK